MLKAITTGFIIFFICQSGSALDKQHLQALAPEIFANTQAITSIVPLTGGLTNQTYLVTWHKDSLVVRLGNEQVKKLGIKRQQELFFHQIASFLDISPTLLYTDIENGLMISRFINGATLTSTEVKKIENMKRLVDIIHQYQKIQIENTGQYSRLTNSHKLLQELKLKVNTISEAHFIKIHQSKIKEYENSLSILETIDLKIPMDPFLVMSHHDLFSNNLIHDGKKIWLIDWEYAQFADRFVDLSCLVSEDELSISEMKALYKIYQPEQHKKEWQRFVSTVAIIHLQTSLWYYLQHFEQPIETQPLFIKKAQLKLVKLNEILNYLNAPEIKTT